MTLQAIIMTNDSAFLMNYTSFSGLTSTFFDESWSLPKEDALSLSRWYYGAPRACSLGEAGPRYLIFAPTRKICRGIRQHVEATSAVLRLRASTLLGTVRPSTCSGRMVSIVESIRGTVSLSNGSGRRPEFIESFDKLRMVSEVEPSFDKLRMVSEVEPSFDKLRI